MIDGIDQEQVDADPTLKAAQIGIELATTPGIRHLIQGLLVEAQDALSELVEIDPTHAQQIARLQETVRRHRDLARLVFEAISAGKAAERQIDQDEPS